MAEKKQRKTNLDWCKALLERGTEDEKKKLIELINDFKKREISSLKFWKKELNRIQSLVDAIEK